MTRLSVNLNKVALMRNARLSGTPSVLELAKIAVLAGADGITVHPRPDQRHIRPEDCYQLAAMLDVEFNIEGNPFETELAGYPGFMNLVRKARPQQCTLVPDSPDQLTSDHGWNLTADGERLRPVIAELKALGCRVSLFMDADSEQIARAAELGADRIELYTESYADAFGTGQEAEVFTRFRKAAETAREAGLGVNAGHDLNLKNLATMATLPRLEEVSIGHALIADALVMGLERTVKAYKAQLS